MLISSPQYGNIPLTLVENQTIRNFWPPGSVAYNAESDFGSILIREYNAGQFRICLVLLNLIRSIPLLFREQKPLVRNRLILEGGFWMKAKGRNKVLLKPGQVLLFNKGDKEESVFFESGGQYSFLDTGYSGAFLQPLMSSFPSLVSFIQEQAPGKEQRQIKEPQYALPELTRIAENLLKCPYDEGLRRIYFEIKMRDYLFQSFVQARQNTKQTNSLNLAEQEAVYKAHQIILSDITRHITIPEIAIQVGLNEKKLKKGFKQVFGSGIYECLHRERMEQARAMLLGSDKPIKEIASLCGFDYLTNFSTAFRRFFGDTPGELRNP